jgi:hypothetical protein
MESGLHKAISRDSVGSDLSGILFPTDILTRGISATGHAEDPRATRGAEVLGTLP